MSDTFVEQPSFAEFLAPDRLDPTCLVNTRYARDPNTFGDTVERIAGTAYDEYIAAERDYSSALFTAASSAHQGPRIPVDATPYVEPLDTYRSAKLDYVEQHGPHLLSVTAATGEMVSKPAEYGQLARFQGGNERPNFALRVFEQPYEGDQIARVSVYKQPNGLAVLLAAWRCRNEWSGLASEWIGKQADNVRARVGLGAIALAD